MSNDEYISWIPCIHNAEAIISTKRRHSLLSFMTGSTCVLPMIYGCNTMSHEEDAIVAFASGQWICHGIICTQQYSVGECNTCLWYPHLWHLWDISNCDGHFAMLVQETCSLQSFTSSQPINDVQRHFSITRMTQYCLEPYVGPTPYNAVVFHCTFAIVWLFGFTLNCKGYVAPLQVMREQCGSSQLNKGAHVPNSNTGYTCNTKHAWGPKIDYWYLVLVVDFHVGQSGFLQFLSVS